LKGGMSWEKEETKRCQVGITNTTENASQMVALTCHLTFQMLVSSSIELGIHYLQTVHRKKFAKSSTTFG